MKIPDDFDSGYTRCLLRLLKGGEGCLSEYQLLGVDTELPEGDELNIGDTVLIAFPDARRTAYPGIYIGRLRDITAIGKSIDENTG